MTNGVDRRAQIDNETARALLFINGGGAIALLAWTPDLLNKCGYESFTRAVLWGLLCLNIGQGRGYCHRPGPSRAFQRGDYGQL